MKKADAKRILAWVNNGSDARATKEDSDSWRAVMKAKEEAGDTRSVKAFCEDFLKSPKQGELI